MRGKAGEGNWIVAPIDMEDLQGKCRGRRKSRPTAVKRHERCNLAGKTVSPRARLPPFRPPARHGAVGEDSGHGISRRRRRKREPAPLSMHKTLAVPKLRICFKCQDHRLCASYVEERMHVLRY